MKLFKRILIIAVILLGITLNSSFADNQQPSPESFTFVQLCDPQFGFGASYEQDVNSFKVAVERINNMKPDFLIICGDMVQSFDDKSVADFNEIKATLKVPCYCCPGNHDIGNEPNEQTLDKYREAFGKDYFSFEHKGYTFIITNTSLWRVTLEEQSQKHDSWFKQTLEAARDKKSPVFVIGHYPMYTNNPDEADGTNNLPAAKRKELLELFENCGVVAVLTGHTHQRIINNYKGIQLVTGETTSRNFDQHPHAFFLWTVPPPDSNPTWVVVELES